VPEGFPAIDELHTQGCLLQGNLGSLAGRYGPEVRRRALYLLHAGLYTHFGSDAHRLDGLEGMVQGGKAVIGEGGEF
jgi:protein-tyrosine phosphatase